jgi:hypothetical protein
MTVTVDHIGNPDFDAIETELTHILCAGKTLCAIDQDHTVYLGEMIIEHQRAAIDALYRLFKIKEAAE